MKHADLNKVGSTEVTIPAFGFGGASLNHPDKGFSIPLARSAIASALDAGVSYFDTAPLYSYGMSERLIGDAVRETGREIRLSTKVGRLLRPGAPHFPGQSPVTNVPFGLNFDYSRDGTFRSIDDSMQRMGVDHFDIIFIHDIDLRTHGQDQVEVFRQAMTQCYPALEELKASGVIGAIGLGVNEKEVCVDALQVADIDCFLLAGRYTLLDNDALDDLLPLCRKRNASIVIGGPYNSGILAAQPGEKSTFDYKPADETIATKVAHLNEVCLAHEVPLPAAALQFPLGEVSVISVIPGARTDKEMHQNLAYFERSIPTEFWASLKSEGLLRHDAPVPRA